MSSREYPLSDYRCGRAASPSICAGGACASRALNFHRLAFALGVALVLPFGAGGMISAAETKPTAPGAVGDGAMHTLTRAALTDKIRGAWAGQMIGVSHGALTEFRSLGRIIEGDYAKAEIRNAINQDDLYVEMTFMQVIDTLGWEARTEDFGEAFRQSRYDLWHANAAARRNLNRGLAAPLSADPRYNLHCDDIDFQIEADFIGVLCPGLPRAAGDLAERVGRVMNHGDGLYGGAFVAGMYAAAFVESDPRRIVEAGLAMLPPESGYARIVRDVLAWSEEHPGDWARVWQLLEDKWNRDDICPDGFGTPFNIDAKLNGAYIILGLLHGGGDFERTMEISTRAGQDSDCNPASAAGILGAVLGYQRLPAASRGEVESIEAVKFQFTEYSFRDIVASSERWALEMIRREGGEVTADTVRIPQQAPVPLAFEESGYGRPVRRVMSTDSAWTWGDGWREETVTHWGRDRLDRVAVGGGHEAVFTFNGTGLGLVGALAENGGRAEVYVDGVRSDLLADAYVGPATHDNDLWRIRGLTPGEHTLRIVTLDDADSRSSGKVVRIHCAIVFGP